MCGIYFCKRDTVTIKECTTQSSKLDYRGPDEQSILDIGKYFFYQSRLHIMDKSYNQPYVKNNYVMCYNGEIYNYKALSHTFLGQPASSDTQVVLEMFITFGPNFIHYLDGMFSIIIVDTQNDMIFVGRDRIGIVSLYYGYTDYFDIVIASELKSLDNCKQVFSFPANTYSYTKTSEIPDPTVYSNIDYIKPYKQDIGYIKHQICSTLTNSVYSHIIQGNIPINKIAFLLSGGLDSSLIVSIARKLFPYSEIHTFSIAVNENTVNSCKMDYIYAREVAAGLHTVHHEVSLDIQDCLAAIPDVIYHTETYDVTTIRASTPMYLLCKHISKLGFRVILSGEGSDELFGGYLYFNKAPTVFEYQNEILKRIKNLQYSDCLRAHKTSISCGIELRVPFLSNDMINLVLRINPEFMFIRNKTIEKGLLRSSFVNDYLPDNILWRQKEQLSDGVGYTWIDNIKNIAKQRFFQLDGSQAENIYYKLIFNTIFCKHAPTLTDVKTRHATIYKWTPNIEWGCSPDPSGLVNDKHLTNSPVVP